MCILDKKTGKIEEMVAAHDVGKAVNPLSCEGQIEGGVVMSIGFALREHYPIDENCKPIDKYGSLGLFRSHEIPKIDAIVVDKPGLNVAQKKESVRSPLSQLHLQLQMHIRWNGERQYSLPLTEHHMKGSAEYGSKEEISISRGCSCIVDVGCRSAEGEAGCADGMYRM